MEIPGWTTNAGALQESGKRSTRSYVDLRCFIGQPVRALGSVWCHMFKRLAYACKLEIRWRIAF
eukprot:6214385-Pleurochrysis_carterae.AAC.3